MSAQVRIWSALPAYTVAVAELPLSAEDGDGPDGAVVVIPGDGPWWHAAQTAVDSGARAIVVARPGRSDPESLAELEAHAEAAAVPVLLERALMRPDAQAAVAQALAAAPHPAVVVAECHAPAAAFPTALRDAIGWARTAAGGSVDIRSIESAGHGLIALLESASGLAVTLIAAESPGASAAGRVRLTTLGETRVELEADGRETRIETTDASGRGIRPRIFERPERVALRRAIDALTATTRPRDLADLGHDETVCARIVRSERP